MESVGEFNFVDGLSLYRPVSLVTLNSEVNNPGEGQEPLWVKQIQQQDSLTNTDSESEKLSEIEEESLEKSGSNYLLNINLKESIVHVSRPSPPLQEAVQNVDKSELGLGKQSDSLQEKINLCKNSNDVMLNASWDKTSSLAPQIDGEDSVQQSLR